MKHQGKAPETPRAVQGPKSAPTQEGQAQRVAFRLIEVEGKAKCCVLYDPQAGVEMQAKVFGFRQARMAFDRSRYWFWVRHFSSKKYYFCHPEESSHVGTIPPLRPSFVRWMLNRECDTTPTKFKDGDYDVELTMKGGAIARQVYFRDGEVETDVIVTEFQIAGGKTFPKKATVFVKQYELTLEVDMGPVEIASREIPDIEPPEGMKGERLKPAL